MNSFPGTAEEPCPSDGMQTAASNRPKYYLYTAPDATQCFNHSPDAKMELLKKLYCRIEEREAAMASVVMFGLTAEEREKVCFALAAVIICRSPKCIAVMQRPKRDLEYKNDCSFYRPDSDDTVMPNSDADNSFRGHPEHHLQGGSQLRVRALNAEARPPLLPVHASEAICEWWEH